MRMCKYCGALIDGSGFGPYRVYCSKACWDAVDGYDRGLSLDRAQRGDVSMESLSEKGNDISDGGAAVESMLDRIDGVSEKDGVGYALRVASEVHPRLPAALVQIAQGKTQAEAAKSVGWARRTLTLRMCELRKVLSRSGSRI